MKVVYKSLGSENKVKYKNNARINAFNGFIWIEVKVEVQYDWKAAVQQNVVTTSW